MTGPHARREGAKEGSPGGGPASKAGKAGELAELRAIARRRLALIAVIYGAATAVLVAVNVATHGPTWWYFAAGGLGMAIVMQALRLRS
jgi:hypothetical protein